MPDRLADGDAAILAPDRERRPFIDLIILKYETRLCYIDTPMPQVRSHVPRPSNVVAASAPQPLMVQVTFTNINVSLTSTTTPHHHQSMYQLPMGGETTSMMRNNNLSTVSKSSWTSRLFSKSFISRSELASSSSSISTHNYMPPTQNYEVSRCCGRWL